MYAALSDAGFSLFLYTVFSSATSVCGLTLLVYAALSDAGFSLFLYTVFSSATSVCGLTLLVYAALSDAGFSLFLYTVFSSYAASVCALTPLVYAPLISLFSYPYSLLVLCFSSIYFLSYITRQLLVYEALRY